MAKRKFQPMLPVVALTLCIAAATTGCGDSASSSADHEAVPVQLMKLASISAAGLSGKIIPDQEVKIVAKSSGKVVSVPVEEGAKVKQGDVLVQLETDDLAQQLKQAEAAVVAAEAKLSDTRAGARTQEIQGLKSALVAAEAAYDQATAAAESAKAALELSTAMYNQLRNLYDMSASVSEEDFKKGTYEFEKAKAGYDQASASQKAAAAQVAAAKAKLELAQAGPTDNTLRALEADVERLKAAYELASHSLSNATITAPMDGIIVKKAIAPGEMAQPGVQLFSLVNMDQVQVELSVPDTQITGVKTGMQVEVSVQNIQGRTYPGTVTYVSPVSNANSNTFPVKVKVDNPDGELLAGMIAEVRLNDMGQAGFELPKSAIVEKDGKQFVYKVSGGAAHAVEVQTEEKNKDWVYVGPNDNLAGNPQIVVKPGEAIAEGVPVKAE